MSAIPLDPVWHPDCASLGGIRRILPPSTQRPSERKMSILFLLRPALGGWVSTGDLRFLRLAAEPKIAGRNPRSEEHTSELQSHHDLVCRLLLEKKKN